VNKLKEVKITDRLKIPDLLKNDKVIKVIFFAGIGIILIILISDLMPKEKKDVSLSNETNVEKYSAEIEKRLIKIISSINGTGNINVMVTLENLEENVYTQKELATVRTPKVRGVAVVCDGGGNAVIREKITSTVAKALGISSARVNVTN
jgi:stage III sporulation protein AG